METQSKVSEAPSTEGRQLVTIVVALVCVGMAMLLSSSAVYAREATRMGEAWVFLKRQLLWLLVAAGAGIAAFRIPLSVWKRFAPWILGSSMLLLIAVFIPGVGIDHRTGHFRWIRLGPLTFQPSELAKVALPIFLAAYLAHDSQRICRFFTGMAPALGVIGGVTVLILGEPDFGTAVLLAGAMLLVMYVTGAKVAHLGLVVCVIVLGFGAFVATHPYVQDRLQTWLEPAEDPLGRGHQMRQSLIALGAGGWSGTGLGRGIQKLLYLPDGHTDFIFAHVGEELGFLGTVGILILYMGLAMVAWRIAKKSQDPFGFHLSVGLSAVILLQAAVNIAVVTAVLPTKGIPLPFLSYGGSSLVFTMVSVGILVQAAEATRKRGGECGLSSPEAAPAATSSPVSRLLKTFP